MAISDQIRQVVRQRANYACEFCGVSEGNAGGALTIDHFQPIAKGGSDDLDNLVYCCPRCNQHKSDYWPKLPNDLPLWNPRRESATSHFLTLDSGALFPLTPTAEFTLHRLVLNREALIEHRQAEIQKMADNARLKSYEEMIRIVPRLMEYLLTVLNENQRLKREMITLMENKLVNQNKNNEDEIP